MERESAPSSLHVNNPKMMHIITWEDEVGAERGDGGGRREGEREKRREEG